jgi:hypothetical protein
MAAPRVTATKRLAAHAQNPPAKLADAEDALGRLEPMSALQDFADRRFLPKQWIPNRLAVTRTLVVYYIAQNASLMPELTRQES